MVSPLSTSIGLTTQPGRSRVEWEVDDPESGTCTTQVYLFPDEVNIARSRSTILEDPHTPCLTVNATTLSEESRGLCLSHSARSLSLANTPVAILNSFDGPSSEEKDARIRSKSTPSRLRGDAKPYVPRRTISLDNLPLSSGCLTSQACFSTSSSMGMANDIGMVVNSILNRSCGNPVHISPTVHVSSLIDTSTAHPAAPKSPRTKYIPAFPTVDENATLNLKPNTYRQLLSYSGQPILVKKPKPANPYITIKRGGDSLQVAVKYNAMPLYWVTIESEINHGSNVANKQETVGPYRSAAVWEFVGQTFAKHDRYKRLKPKRRRAVRECLDRVTPPSKLSTQVFADDDEGENMYNNAEVRAEWTEFVNSTDNLDCSPPSHISHHWVTSPPVSTYERKRDGSQLDDDRGRRRTRGNMLDRYSFEKMPPTSSFSSLAIPYARFEAALQKDTVINNHDARPTHGTGKFGLYFCFKPSLTRPEQSSTEQQEATGLGLALW